MEQLEIVYRAFVAVNQARDSAKFAEANPETYDLYVQIDQMRQEEGG